MKALHIRRSYPPHFNLLLRTIISKKHLAKYRDFYNYKLSFSDHKQFKFILLLYFVFKKFSFSFRVLKIH